MKWTDVFDIAIELSDQFPDTDPQYVNFVDLRNGYWPWMTLTMIPIAVVRKSWRVFKLPGWKKSPIKPLKNSVFIR